MKGSVFTEFMDMIDQTFSVEVCENLIDISNLPSQGIYTSVGTYDFSEIRPTQDRAVPESHLRQLFLFLITFSISSAMSLWAKTLGCPSNLCKRKSGFSGF